jgi:hypothetical protein
MSHPADFEQVKALFPNAKAEREYGHWQYIVRISEGLTIMLHNRQAKPRTWECATPCWERGRGSTVKEAFLAAQAAFAEQAQYTRERDDKVLAWMGRCVERMP